MRIRDPKTGKIFDSIIGARLGYCKNDCKKCGLSPEKYGKPNCDQVVLKHAATALKIMEYEMLDDEEIKTCHTCKNEPKILSGKDCWCKRCLLQCKDDAWEPKEVEPKAYRGKQRPSLVPPALIRGVDAIREYGCTKYHDPENWRKVEAQRYWDAALRHALAAWNDWTAVDEESGMPHIWHMACNLAFLMQYMEKEREDK